MEEKGFDLCDLFQHRALWLERGGEGVHLPAPLSEGGRCCLTCPYPGLVNVNCSFLSGG